MTDIAAPANVLVLAPAHDEDAREVCFDLLTPSASDGWNVLWVTLTGSPDDRLAAWREHVGEALPADVRFVDVGGETRSTSPSDPRIPGASFAVETVSSPRDLTTLGVRITNGLAELTGGEAQTVVCFDSLTPMLQYVELERAFQFLHVLARNVHSEGVLAHYHMDPGAHSEQAVNTIKTLADTVVDPRGNGATVDAEDVSAAGATVPPEPDENDEAVAYRTTFAEDETPAEAVVRSIAAVEGIDAADVATPWDRDALDELLSPSAESAVGVDFEVGDYVVRVAAGTMTVHDADPPWGAD